MGAEQSQAREPPPASESSNTEEQSQAGEGRKAIEALKYGEGSNATEPEEPQTDDPSPFRRWSPEMSKIEQIPARPCTSWMCHLVRLFCFIRFVSLSSPLLFPSSLILLFIAGQDIPPSFDPPVCSLSTAIPLPTSSRAIYPLSLLPAPLFPLPSPITHHLPPLPSASFPTTPTLIHKPPFFPFPNTTSPDPSPTVSLFNIIATTQPAIPNSHQLTPPSQCFQNSPFPSPSRRTSTSLTPLHPSHLCTNALCHHIRCGSCYDVNVAFRVFRHSDGTPVRGESWFEGGKGWGAYWWR
jgi:hypothetical protein